MLIEDYKRINGWLNIRLNPKDNQSLYDFSEFFDGEHHTLSEADELYNEFIQNHPECSKREDAQFVYRKPDGTEEPIRFLKFNNSDCPKIEKPIDN